MRIGIEKINGAGLLVQFGVIWAFFWGIHGYIHQGELFLRILTFEELNQTIWTTTGPLIYIQGLAPSLVALVAGIGLLIHAGARGSTVWKYGIGIFLAVILSFVIGSLGHFPPLYAIGGTLILFFFFGILWFWNEERKDLKGQSTAPADLKLTGCVFILIAAWYTCGIAGCPGTKHLPTNLRSCNRSAS